MQVNIGDKVVEAEMKNGVPVIKATSEEIHHPDGRVDCVIHVPCLTIQSNVKE